MTARAPLAAEIVRVCRAMYDRGMIAGIDGNVSARLDDGAMLITPGGVAKGSLVADDLVVVDADGRSERGTASSEIRMHRRIYQARPDVGAVVHGHPPAATAFALAGLSLLDPVYPELIQVSGPVPLVPYGRSGTPDLPGAIAPYLAEYDVFLLANHGVTATGATLAEAYERIETVEHGARIMAAARALGGPAPLPGGEGEALLRAWRDARQRRLSSRTV